MSELAFNINGEAFNLPATATGWRVRRMKQRGAPEVVYGKDGVPVVLPVDADLEELRALVVTPGRYRLDAIDNRGHTVAELPASYVVIAAREPQVSAQEPRVADTGATSLIAEAMRHNTELAKSVIDKFPEMMKAAAELLRAADGAGIPARRPLETEIELDDGDDDTDADDTEVSAAIVASPAGFDLNAIVAQIVPMLITNLMSGKLKVPGLASMFDWRKAAPANDNNVEAEPAPAPEKPKKLTTARAAAEPVVVPALDAAAMAHVVAIQAALTPKEVAYVQEVARELEPADLRSWFDKLSKLSVPAAVETIRALIAGDGKIGGAP